MQIRAINNTSKILSFKNKQKEKTQSSSAVLQSNPTAVKTGYMQPSLIDRMPAEMRNLFSLMKNVKIEEQSLASRIKGFTFVYDKNFDTNGWTTFIKEMDDATAVFENQQGQYKKSFLEILDSVVPIPKLLTVKDFKPNKAIEFLDEYYNRDDEEISKFPINAQMEFMVQSACSKVPVEEFVSDMFYFRSLKTEKGESVLAERNGYMNTNQVKAIKYALSVDKGSVEASNFDMLLDLVKSGVVGNHVFNNIPVNGKIASLIVGDIDKLYSAYEKGIKPIDVFVPTFETQEEAEQSLDVGDVYELKNEKNIFAVNKYGISTQLGIDKQTYFDLFPPIERFATTQGDIGNCWELTALNALFADKEERIKILQLFSQDGDDIVVKMPNGNYSKHVFKNGEFPFYADKKYYSKGAKGIQFLEYVDGQEFHADKIRFLILQYRHNLEKAKNDDEKLAIETKMAKLLDLLDYDFDSVVVSLDENDDWTFAEWDYKKHGFDNGATVGRDGGNASELFMRFQYPIEVYSKDEMARNEFISYPENFKNNIVTYGIPKGVSQDKAPEGLLIDHSYRMYPMEIDENGKISKFKLIDPHSIIEIPISYEDIQKCGGIVDIAQKKNTSGEQTVSFKGRQITLSGTLRQKSLNPNLLAKEGFEEKDVDKDALRFLRKLDRDVVKHIKSVDKNGEFFVKLLTKSEEFQGINYDHISNVASLLNLFNLTYANDETLLSTLDDFSFIADKDFDAEAWGDFIYFFDNAQRYGDDTFLEKFLEGKGFSELFYSKDFEPTAVLDFVCDIKDRIGYYTQYELFEILDFVSSYANDRYDSLQRVDALAYFQELRDVNGTLVFPQKEQSVSQLEAFKYMLNINPTTVKSSNMEMLLDLVVNGVVGNHVFDYLPTEVELNSLVVSDIDKLYDAYINGVEPIDAFVPTYNKESDAIKELKIGDVFEVENEEFIRIKTKKNASTQLNITKQTYFELFPPVERYATTQGKIGNCWQMAGLNSIFRDENERVNLLKMFYQDGEDILIKFPQGEYEEIRFDKGNLPETEKLSNYSKGAKGFKLLEYADGKELQAYRVKNYFLYLLKEMVNGKTLADKQKAQEKLREIQKLIDLGIENLVVRKNDKTDEWECFVFKETKNGYNTAEVQGRHGGDAIRFFQRIGYQNSFWKHVTSKSTEKTLANPKTFDKFVVIWNTKEGLRNTNYETLGLHENHAYPIVPAEVDKQGRVLNYNVFDPWGCAMVKLTYEQLKYFGSFVQFAERKSYK